MRRARYRRSLNGLVLLIAWNLETSNRGTLGTISAVVPQNKTFTTRPYTEPRGSTP